MSEEIHTASLPDFGFLYGCCYSCLCYPEQVITSLPTVPISIISHLPAFWYEVTAVKGMDELGASQIRLQRSADGVTWTTVKTYSSNDYSTFSQSLQIGTAVLQPLHHTGEALMVLTRNHSFHSTKRYWLMVQDKKSCVTLYVLRICWAPLDNAYNTPGIFSP